MKIAMIVIVAVILMSLFIFLILLFTGKLNSVTSSIVSIIFGSLKISMGGV